jgi:hypothetical protein
MTPKDLRPELFANYPLAGRAFAVEYLLLLRRLPFAVCPLFLREIQRLDTSFPAEAESLRLRCEFLQALSPAEFTDRTDTLRKLRLSPDLESIDWVATPSRFISALTAYLWSSGQIDVFRAASISLLASAPTVDKDASRMTIILAGAGVSQPHGELFRKLRKHGLLLTGLDAATMPKQIEEIFNNHAAAAKKPYANWYIDGGSPLRFTFPPSTITTSYPQLEPLRLSTLSYVDAFIQARQGGAEEMRSSLSGITPADIRAEKVTSDPVLQRFYTELFTESSGPQIFSTSFVQWAGRELARRVRPLTVLLRYGPRQRQRSLDDLFRRADDDSLDPEGALRDAEMGAYYNFLEMDRITSPGRGTFVLWIEGTTTGILVAPGAPAGARTDMPISLKDALRNFS